MSEAIGFLGLGHLGLPMAMNLLDAGRLLGVYNRTTSKAEPLVARGVRLGARPADVVTPGGIVATVLWDDAALEEVVRSEGFLDRLGPGGVHVSMSTVLPETARKLSALHAEHGAVYLEAPVFGRPVVAVPFGGDARFVTVASPAYVRGRGTPSTPDDLAQHACIRFRMPSGKPFRWEFARRGQARAVEVPGVLTLDHPGLMAEAAADGLGIAYVPERVAQPLVADGRLVEVLGDWCPRIDGLCLYYPAGRRVPPALRVFVDALREAQRERASASR